MLACLHVVPHGVVHNMDNTKRRDTWQCHSVGGGFETCNLAII